MFSILDGERIARRGASRPAEFADRERRKFNAMENYSSRIGGIFHAVEKVRCRQLPGNIVNC